MISLISLLPISFFNYFFLSRLGLWHETNFSKKTFFFAYHFLVKCSFPSVSSAFLASHERREER
jgi:hypothetical protein